MKVVADFETTTDANDCRVWGWGICEIESGVITIGETLDAFIGKIKYNDEIEKVYFHNLKFDGEFILNWLFRNGFRFSENKTIYPGEFTTLISDMGTFYTIKVNFDKNMITFVDSLKIIPLPVAKIPKAFGLQESKGSIDYSFLRPIGYKLTENEKDYIAHDVSIVAAALKQVFDGGLLKITQAANALDSYKKLVGKKNFERWFPALDSDKWLRRSYKGGFTYADPRFQGKDIQTGSVYDVNSLYPSVMYKYPMPYGHPVWFDGKPKKDKIYPLYIVAFTCEFRLKPGMIPTIQLKHTMRFSDTEYLTSSDGEDITLTLTSVDCDLFFKHYDVFDLEWIGGYKFMARDDMFRQYIDHWTEVKTAATLEGNKGKRTMAKLMLNSLYGKFGMNPVARSKWPRWNADADMVQYHDGPDEIRKPLYVAVASFTTAYARRETITAAQANYGGFMYADTDSLHLLGEDMPSNIKVDAVELGAWKKEKVFSRARFIRAKTYIEEVVEMDGERLSAPKLEITCAGMPARCHDHVTFDNFHTGLRVPGKLQHKRVPGGVVLSEIEFTIKM